jgi:hypothetical protein
MTSRANVVSRLLTSAALAGVIILGPRCALAQEEGREPDANVPPDDRDDSWVERQQKRFDHLKDLGLTFRVGAVVSGSGLSFGTEVTRPFFGRGFGVSGGGMWSVRGYAMYDVRVGVLEHLRDQVELRPADSNIGSVIEEPEEGAPGWSAYVHARWRDYPTMAFYGPAESATETDRRNFRMTGTSFDGVLQWQHTPRFGMSGRVGVLDLDAEPNLADGEDAPALVSVTDAPRGRGARHVTVGVAAVLDRRDIVGAPTRGTFGAIAWTNYDPVEANARGFDRTVLDGRYFVRLKGANHVLATRLVLAVTRRHGDALVPYYLQQTLGGSSVLRGLSSYRVRGEGLATVSVEYRWRVHRWVEIAPFVDFGRAADRSGQVSSPDLLVTPGVGLRGRTDSRVFGRLDWAHGPNGHRLILTMGRAY